MSSLGIVYGVSGLAWFAETIVSAISCKKHMPTIPIELFIDSTTHKQLQTSINCYDYFDYVTMYEDHNNWRSAKFKALQFSRFEKTLYLDNDTYITDTIEELFSLLNRFDIALMPSIKRINPKTTTEKFIEILPYTPLSFPEYNGGVFLFRKNEVVTSFLNLWIKLFKKTFRETEYKMDQMSLRAAIYHSAVSMTAITPEYNFIASKPNIIEGKIKIIHSHGSLEAINQQVNRNDKGIRMIPANRHLTVGMTPEFATTSDNEKVIKEIQKIIIAQKTVV